jgi:hypothetical protein
MIFKDKVMRSRLFPDFNLANFAMVALSKLASGVAVWMLSTHAAFALQVDGCGTVGEGILVDYRMAKSEVDSVATAAAVHFTTPVETLQSGFAMKSPGPDITYTLQRVPNHYRALLSMVALGEREKTSKPLGSEYSLECWFRRGVAIFPDDNTVRMLYAQYLYKSSRNKEAEAQLSVASRQAADNAFTLNNIGLVYFDAKNYEQSLLHAHKAYALGLGNMILKEQLKSVGKWQEPTEAPPVEPANKP